MNRRPGGLSIVFLPDEGGESKTWHMSPKGVKILAVAGGLGFVIFGLMFASWWFFALNTAQNYQLQALVDSLEEERVQILSLAEDLNRVEAEYENIRSLFGLQEATVAPDLWLPPSGLPGSRSPGQGEGSDENLPTEWPLTEAGFITQSLIAGATEDHPGLDIAIPTDSYVRAAGAGTVLRVGDDPLYGLFVVLDHGDGYQTVYAHTSSILVERGRSVRKREVIALSGSTGQSTAPHLHFEILMDGIPMDPLSMVEPPS